MNARSQTSAATFDEMRRILRDLPGPDLDAQTEVVRRQAELTKPPGSLGRLEEIADWLAAWQGRAQPARRAAADRGLRRHPRRRRARRLGLSARSHRSRW